MVQGRGVLARQHQAPRGSGPLDAEGAGPQCSPEHSLIRTAHEISPPVRLGAEGLRDSAWRHLAFDRRRQSLYPSAAERQQRRPRSPNGPGSITRTGPASPGSRRGDKRTDVPERAPHDGVESSGARLSSMSSGAEAGSFRARHVFGHIRPACSNRSGWRPPAHLGISRACRRALVAVQRDVASQRRSRAADGRAVRRPPKSS